MKTAIDTRLERDSRYVAAKDRFNELKAELDAAEKNREDALSGLSSLGAEAGDRLKTEAQALLSGALVRPASNRELLNKTLNEVTHRIAVLKEATAMQKTIVGDLRAEVGKAIATDLLPQHRANVSAVMAAALQLSTALQAEAELRDTLSEQDVPFTNVIRPMALPGFNLRDDQSRLTRWLLECYEHGYVKAADLPDIVRDRVPKPQAKTAPATPKRSEAARDGWLQAA